MKFKWNGYFEPTPPMMRRVGMAFKAVAGANVPIALSGYVSVGVALFLIGALGSFLCNLFVESPQTGPQTPPKESFGPEGGFNTNINTKP